LPTGFEITQETDRVVVAIVIIISTSPAAAASSAAAAGWRYKLWTRLDMYAANNLHGRIARGDGLGANR
jgi:hypothetical protein